MKGMLIPQNMFNEFFDGSQRFISLSGPEASGAVVIASDGDPRRMRGVAMEYEDGVVTVEITARIEPI